MVPSDRTSRGKGIERQVQRKRSEPCCFPHRCEYHSRTEEGTMGFRLLAALAGLFAFEVLAQAPATPPPPVPADVSPLYVVTYIELKPSARSEGAAILQSWREA